MSGENEPKREHPLKVYAVVSQIGFMVIVPLLIFIWGGSALINALSLPSWLMVIFVIVGILSMICSVGSYLARLIKRYDKDKKEDYKYLSDRRDNDYYVDNPRRKKL